MRNGDAEEKGRAGGRELREEPAVGELIVKHDRIARIFRLAGAAETSPKRVIGRRTKKRGARLIEDLKAEVAHRHDVVWANRAVWVRRDDAAGVGLAVEGNDRSRDLSSATVASSAERRLHDRIPLGSKANLVWHDVAVFVLAQLARSGQI